MEEEISINNNVIHEEVIERQVPHFHKRNDNSDSYGFQDPGDISFGRAAFEKIVTIMLSVKVHIMVSLLIISTWLLVNGYISGGEWTTVNTTVISIVVGLRETFKMSAINYKRTAKTNTEKFKK